MPIAKSRLPPAAIFTAAMCSATLPTSGTMISPMNTAEMPVSSIVGSIAATRISDRTPVASAVTASIVSDSGTLQRAVPCEMSPPRSGSWNEANRYRPYSRIMITAIACVRPRSSASVVFVVAANSVGIASAAVASTSIVAFRPAVARSNVCRPFFTPENSSAAPRISSTLPITDPMIDARATSSRPSRIARITMIISGRFPNVAFRSAEMRGTGRLAGLLGGDAEHPCQPGHGDAGADEHDHR